MKASAILAILGGLAWGLAPTQADDYVSLKRQAEQSYAEGSYELARRAYERAAKLELDDDQRRWVDFRLADTSWRSATSTAEPDNTVLDQSRAALLELAPGGAPDGERDRVWGEARESLGDSYWNQGSSPNWGGGWPHYQAAFDYWAGSSDIELARRRYLGIVWRISSPAWSTRDWIYGYHGRQLPVDVLRNAVDLAVEPTERSRAHYLLGMHYAQQGRNPQTARRAVEELQAALDLGPSTAWYDDALYHYGRFLEDHGRPRMVEGAWSWESDYVGALEVYRRLMREFGRGETRYFGDARNRIASISDPVVSVTVQRFFLPGSEIEYGLSWRNVERVALTLYPVDLTAQLDFPAHDPSSWLEAVRLEALEPRTRWTHATEDAGEHRPGQASLTLPEELPLGAWVLEARSGGKRSRALILVSDAALTVKLSGEKLLVWFTDVSSGEPLPGADVRVWESFHDGHDQRSRGLRGKTEADGTLLLELREKAAQSRCLVTASLGDRQAFVTCDSWRQYDPSEAWKIYAFTDRPAYRPLDRVRWKFVARVQRDSAYATPAGSTVAWEVIDPRQSTIAEGRAELNAFGAAWSEIETTQAMPLGEYQVRFFVEEGGSRRHVGQAALFRLEEYKAPEFEVTVATPEDPEHPGRPRLFRVGDEVELDVEAKYYYGAPVADANVEVFVYQKPFRHVWPREREFPWFYDEGGNHPWWGGQGQQVSHQVLKTDRAGRARVRFDTPFDLNQDFEYTIEARVTDASRREIVGRETLRVTRQSYFVRVEPKHALHRPGAAIEVEVEARDPNGNPVAAKGRIEATRERWIEVWADPSGREVRGAEIDRLRARHGAFPPPTPGWRQKFAGYERDVVATSELRTAGDGTASWSFVPRADGYYRVAWRSLDDGGVPVEASATVFVADEATRDLGYLPGGVDILVDKDTFEVGQAATVMLATPASGRWVLFTVEADGLLHHEVVHLRGTVKLLELPLTRSHVPNVFLTATTVADGLPSSDFEEIVVPPTGQFLDVEVAYGEDDYRPGEKGELNVLVRDRDGAPVASVELGLAVVDDALSYIQDDYAGDPRRFFYGERRWQQVITRGTFDHGSFVRLVKDDSGAIVRQESAAGELRRKTAYEGKVEYRRASASGPATASDEFFLGAAERSAVPGRGGAKEAAGVEPSVRVRSDFRDTALWAPGVMTDRAGRAKLEFPLPDSTTRWKASVRACDTGARFGIGSAIARTRQPLIARLQAPRFFQTGDEVVISGNVNNDTEGAMSVQVELVVEGLELLGNAAPVTVSVPAGDQRRLDWKVRVHEPGTAVLKLEARSEVFGDAVERRYPIHEHGIEAFEALSGKLTEGELALALDLPRERKPGTTDLRIRIAPSLAVTMLDALPYLVDYPYGCTEQTLSRFVPAVIVAKTLRDLGLSAEEAMRRAFGGIEREHASQTHAGEPTALDRLDDVVARGLERLYDFQHADGGWGWWKDGDSDRYMSAYVLWGLSLARDAGVEVREGVLERAARWLAAELVAEENDPHMQAWMLHALAVHGRETDARSRAFVEAAFERVVGPQAERLNAYSRALAALAAHHLGREAVARRLMKNLYNGVQIDETPDTSVVQVGPQGSRPHVLKTAHWGRDRLWRRWHEGGIEASAFALRAMLAVDPDHELVEPVTNWLIKNRRAAQWSNTRDTAIAVLALNDYLRASGELEGGVAYELSVNGNPVATQRLSKGELLRAPAEFRIDPGLVQDENRIVIRRLSGDGPLYFAAEARFFSLEEPVAARGSEVFLRREYFKLVGRPTLLKGFVYDRVPLRDGDSVTSGERIEVVLTAEAKNDLEYLIFEDLKPAGFEAVRVRSGEPLTARELRSDEVQRRFDPAVPRDASERRGVRDTLEPTVGPGTTGRSRSVHQELRDRRVALFLDRLPEGVWEMRYDLRAEIPGQFHALPAQAHAMYVPEIRCNGAELRVSVLDAQ